MDSEVEERLSSPAFIARLESLLRIVKRLLRHRPVSEPKSAAGSRGLDFLEYRPYLPGDDLQRLDWKVYRRLGELAVREYVRESPSHWLIGLDCSPSMGLYGKFSFARRIAAALLYTGVSLVGKVTFCVFPNERRFSCAHRSSVRAVLEALDELKVEPARSAAASCLGAICGSLPSHTKAILVSDFYGSACREILAPVSLRKFRGVAVHTVAREEKEPAFRGRCVLRDAESGRIFRLRVTSSEIQEYRRKFREHLEEVRLFCTRSGVHYQQADPRMCLDKTALETLRWTGVLR